MSRANWWGTPSQVSTRLRLEVELMRATFADTFRLVVPKRDLLYWLGDVEINMRGIPAHPHAEDRVPPYPNRPGSLRSRVCTVKHQFEDGQFV